MGEVGGSGGADDAGSASAGSDDGAAGQGGAQAETGPELCASTERIGAGLNISVPQGINWVTSAENTRVLVQTRASGGEWLGAKDVLVDWAAQPRLDVSLVVDNSGSQRNHLATEVSAIKGFARALFAGESKDRLGIVRVSTGARPLLELTDELSQVDKVAASLSVTNGWTALWDGIRVANEQLDRGAMAPDPSAVCYAGAYRSVVVFTDGRDNNSRAEESVRYDDGIATSLAALLNLRAANMRTAIYPVGIGKNIDVDSLRRLATATGGRYTPIADWSSLVETLKSTASKLHQLTPICFIPASCDHTEARTLVTTVAEGETLTSENVFPIR
jgi:Mg-chelatase subunit ChlD